MEAMVVSLTPALSRSGEEDQERARRAVIVKQSFGIEFQSKPSHV
jgi:hypothetical protein